MKTIVSILFATEESNRDEIIQVLGEEFRLIQFSVNFNLDLALALIEKFDGISDVISLSGLPPSIKFKKNIFTHPDVRKLKAHAKKTPVVDGHIFKDVYIPFILREFEASHKMYLKEKKWPFTPVLFSWPMSIFLKN